jgi:hypothetical protein
MNEKEEKKIGQETEEEVKNTTPNAEKKKDEKNEEEEEVRFINCLGCEKEIPAKKYPAFDLFSTINVNCEDCWKKIKDKQKIHCDICKRKFPSELLRPPYEDIINSKALYKTLVTGKGNGKSINLMM